jgi:hypothetical protein
MVDLFRLYAFSVAPARTRDSESSPVGGPVSISDTLKGVIANNSEEARFDEKPLVDFVVDTDTRTCDPRELLLALCFGTTSEATKAATNLAARLGDCMDRRSSDCLFVPTVFRREDLMQAILWVFPQEAAFQLHRDSDGPILRVLDNVFSQRSWHRKAAQFQGRNRRTDLLRGRILDHQANVSSRVVANYWMSRFLACTFAIKNESGSRLLARYVRQADDKLSSPQSKQHLRDAVIALRSSPNKRTSLSDFAERFLDGEAKEVFIRLIRDQEYKGSSFDLVRETFDEVVQFAVFDLTSGVSIYSPIGQLGESVHLEEGLEGRRLRCEGEVLDEKLRSRRA